MFALFEQVTWKDQGTQWERLQEDHTYSQLSPLFGSPLHSMADALSEVDIVFYTGLSGSVFTSLAGAVSAMGARAGKLSVKDQLLLCLIRLRLGLLYGHLARIFSVSVSTAGNVVKAMLGFLKKVLVTVVVWLPRKIIRNSMPQSFIENGHGRTTCIVDCTEVHLQRPRKLMPRAQTFSGYKAHNTIKFLVAIAPNGYIMHVSKAYEGRASDKVIMRDCGIEDYLVRGDEVMADRGFTLEPELEAQGVKLNMPAFTKGKAQLSEQEVTATRRIAAVRIHVECAINRMKTYRIFKQSLPIRSKKAISDMIFVVAGLCNLKPPLIRGSEANDSE
ncbi:unnamed protein product [Ixodes hexagonus]